MPDNKGTLVFDGVGGDIEFNVDFRNETIWATQKQIADLFGVSVSAISKQLNAIFLDGELTRSATVSKMEIVADEGGREVRRQVEHYNLDVVISVGYRINSQKATQFRQWATSQLRELITKGFVIDDNRFADAQLGALNELVQRVRAIRTSEKNLFKKITDIFATSVDYQAQSDAAWQFFASVQNKFHYATTGHTATELVYERADSQKRNMGLTNWSGKNIAEKDATVAKNYYKELELKKLELLSEQFLSHAELMAMDGKAMKMKDWAQKLDDFLAFNDKEILQGLGSVSRPDMLKRVKDELEKYRATRKIQ